MRTTSALDSVKYIMHLAWPAIIEQILLTAATYVDTAMIGALGYHATAAMAVDAPITWLISGLMTAFGVGYSVQIAHSIGAENRSHVREISRQAFIGSVFFWRCNDADIFCAVVLSSSVARRRRLDSSSNAKISFLLCRRRSIPDDIDGFFRRFALCGRYQNADVFKYRRQPCQYCVELLSHL